MKKVALHNLGCKVNAYETEAMQELLINHGYEIVPFKEGADIYIINTCTVTNIADRKSRQMLHRARKMNPKAIVVAAGCYVQTKGEEADDCIDIIIGNNRKQDLIQILEEYVSGEWKAEEGILDINHTNQYEELRISKTAGHTRAYIKIQDGCNQFCSYCIIPYARGRVRSRERGSILAEVCNLAENGYKEVVLTGIHLSSYGTDTKDELLELIEAIHQVKGIARIRMGSLEPRIITESFVRSISKLPKVCPHFHLSLQSGSNATLKRMNRRYTAEEYDEKCQVLRMYYDAPAITTDIIVGFPGETEAEFEECQAFVEKVGFYETHVFKYSKREGTKAAKMKEQVSEDIKSRRSNVLLALSEKSKAAYEEKLIGSVKEVLMEELVEVNGDAYMVGHTKEYVKIGRKESENRANQLVNVEIKSRLQIMH